MNIKFNNETIKNAIIDALDKMERGIEISEVDRDELINVILKYGDRDFGIKNKDTGKYYTKEELQCSVYIHIVNENNKCYVGQTSRNPKDRWQRNGIEYEGQVVYNPIKKYGWDNTSHIVICNELTQKEANDMEVALICILKSTNIEFGYNVANGGNGVGQHSEETKKKMSEARKGEKHYMYGKQHSEETKKKLSEACKGKHRSEETRKKISECGKGKHISEETRKKIGEAHKGENNYMYGKQHSKETRKKMSETLKGKHPSEETRKKMSEARKGKYVGENSPNAKKVLCNGQIFTTAKECAKFYNVNYSTMSCWLQGRRKTPRKFMELELRYATEDDLATYPLHIEK